MTAEQYLEEKYKDSILPKETHAWRFDEVAKEMEEHHAEHYKSEHSTTN